MKLDRIGCIRVGSLLVLTSVLLSIPGNAEAQLYGGVYGGYGWGGGSPDAFGGLGRTLAEQELLKQQWFEMNAAQYALMSAQATQVYQAANLMNQQAISYAIANAKAQKETAYFHAAIRQQNAEGLGRLGGARWIPPAGMLTPDGAVLWPRITPRDRDLAARRAAADLAIRAAVTEYAATGAVQSGTLDRARAGLDAYGKAVVKRLRARHSHMVVVGYRTFLTNLDVALQDLAVAGQERAAGAAMGLEVARRERP